MKVSNFYFKVNFTFLELHQRTCYFEFIYNCSMSDWDFTPHSGCLGRFMEHLYVWSLTSFKCYVYVSNISQCSFVLDTVWVFLLRRCKILLNCKVTSLTSSSCHHLHAFCRGQWHPPRPSLAWEGSWAESLVSWRHRVAKVRHN